jgi:cellulose synthase/poly-beta-1,6-N-acetylglucosamine synthase-like glycosyltransferase
MVLKGAFKYPQQMDVFYLPLFLLTIPKFLFHTGVFSLLHLYFVRQWYSLHFGKTMISAQEPIVILFPRMKINIKRSSKINTNVFLLSL